MIKLPTRLNMFLGKIRYLLAKVRKFFLEVCVLSPGHWKWAAYAILLIIALFMAGMAIDFVGELHIGIYLAALLFFPGLALLSGLGVRLGLKLLNLVPQKQSWIFFGAIFFVLFFFGLPDKAMVPAPRGKAAPAYHPPSSTAAKAVGRPRGSGEPPDILGMARNQSGRGTRPAAVAFSATRPVRRGPYRPRWGPAP